MAGVWRTGRRSEGGGRGTEGERHSGSSPGSPEHWHGLSVPVGAARIEEQICLALNGAQDWLTQPRISMRTSCRDRHEAADLQVPARGGGARGTGKDGASGDPATFCEGTLISRASLRCPEWCTRLADTTPNLHEDKLQGREVGEPGALARMELVATL